MTALLELLAPALSGKGLDTIGAAVGLDRAQTEKGVDSALPAVLGRLKERADDPAQGPALVTAIKKDHQGGLLDSISDHFAGGRADEAKQAMGMVFGNDADNESSGPIAALATAAGIGGGAMKGLLTMVLPLVMGALGKLGGTGINPAALSGLLGSAVGEIGGGSATKLLAGLAQPGSATAAAKAAVAGVAGAGLAGAAAVGGGAAKASASAVSAAKAGVKVAGAPVVTAGKKRFPLVWLLAALAVLLLAVLALSKCGTSDHDAAVTEPAVVAETTAGPVETAPAADTTMAAPETTLAPAATDLTAGLGANADLSKFNEALAGSGLATVITGPGPFTVFAPSNAAWDALPQQARDHLLSADGKADLDKVVGYHLVPKRVEGADLVSGDVATIEGHNLVLTVAGSDIGVSNGSANSAAKVVGAAVSADNGLIYTLDRVLLPPDLVLPGSEETADMTAMNAAGDATPEDLTVYFDTAKSDIRADQQSKIDNAIAKLKTMPAGSMVHVVGHADTRGDAAKNQALSEARAQKVVDAITAGLGDSAANIAFDVSAKGDTEQQADLEHSRRVTIEIM